MPPQSPALQRKLRVTVRDLARDLGMSVSTVSRAFHAEAVIAPDTRAAVLKRASEIGYVPNPFAQSLITKRTRIVGVVVADITNPFYPEVLTRLTADLRAVGMNVMLVAADESGNLDESVRLLLNYQPDLMIILAATLSSEAAKECRHSDTPLIFFNRLSADADSFGVTCENEAGGSLVADFLVDQGHRRLAYLSAHPDASTNLERGRGFSRRVVERGLPAPLWIAAGRFEYDAGYAAAGQLADATVRPDGVFCANDILAIGFIDGLRNELRLDVPADISVVGFDDIAMARWPSHALTTVRQPVEAMLAATITLAARLSLDPREVASVQRIAPGCLIQRATTRRRTAK